VSSLLQYLLKRRVDLDAGDTFRVTALHLAAIEDHHEVCRLLLEAQASPCLADNEGDLPIHWAATKGHSDVRPL
jgi:ankyrin repeat protein